MEQICTHQEYPQVEHANRMSCHPPCLGVTRGDHVSWPAMETLIPTMMMIKMSTNSIPAVPRIASSTSNQPSSSHPVNSVYGRW
jgi:hypothetical protein